MSAEDFLFLLKEWEKLCIHFSLRNSPNSEEYENLHGMTNVEDNEDVSEESDDEDDGEVFTVEKIVGISFGVPKKLQKRGLYLKVLWLCLLQFSHYISWFCLVIVNLLWCFDKIGTMVELR